MNPEQRITAWLATNKSKIEFSTLSAVVQKVKLDVFYGMPPISDDEIRAIVTRWAGIHAIGLLMQPSPSGAPGSPTTPAKSSPHSENELIASVKKAITAVTEGVTIGKQGANINIGVTGLTANLKKGVNSASLNLSWGGALKLEAASGPIHFQGTLSKDNWQITVSFPQDTYIPDLSQLGKVFSEAETAIGGVAETTKHFQNIQQSAKVGALIKPHMEKVGAAVDALGGIAKASPKGGASFGFQFGSPPAGPGEQGIPGGVQGTIVFTYRF